MTKEISPQKARQGRRGTRVLLILIVSIILALLAWWGAEIYGERIAKEPPATEQSG
jgi:hypothetical protein